MLKTAIKYGLIAGIFSSILFHVSRIYDIHPLTDLRHLLFDIVILAVFIFFAVFEYKKYHNHGILHFWQGMSLGFLVYLPAVLFFGVFLKVYFDDILLQEYQELASQLLENQKEMYIDQLGEEQYIAQKEEIYLVTESRLIMSSILKKLVAGFFVTPALSVVLRKKPN